MFLTRLGLFWVETAAYPSGCEWCGDMNILNKKSYVLKKF
jgi:hypothetical protein